KGEYSTLLPDVHERPQLLGPAGVPELPERLAFDLADALPRHVEALPHFLERVLRPVADPEAHAQDLLFARGERFQRAARLVLEARDDHGVDRRDDLTVRDEIAA